MQILHQPRITFARANGSAYLNIAITLLVLSGQNLLIFWRHYFYDISFPDDFLLTYHAIPYYWIEVVKLGKGISWIPFQGMGYPLFLNMQSGEFYFPFWLFVLFKGTYTIHAAVVMQCVHVLFGAIGASVCARLLGLAWRESIFIGILYQCFGGFYSNSQHPDIVRAFAFLPWLCGPVFADWKARSIALNISTVILPIWVLAMWTGGYPGTAMASLFLLGIICTARILAERGAFSIGIHVLSALLAGTIIAGLFLAPPFLSSGEIDRAISFREIAYDYMSQGDILAFAFPIDNLFFQHDISMRSFFVGFPVIGLFMMSLTRFNRRMFWPLVCGLMALLVVFGPLHQIFAKAFMPLGFSRFVMADYRALICLVVILVAVGALNGHTTSVQGGGIWPLLFVIYIWYGVDVLSLVRSYANEDHIALLVVLLLGVAATLNKLSIKIGTWTLEPLLLAAGTAFIWYSNYLTDVLPAPAGGKVIMAIKGITFTALVVSFVFGVIWKKGHEPLLIISGAIVTEYIASLALFTKLNQNGVMIPIAIFAILTIIALSPTFMRAGRRPAIITLTTITIFHWFCATWNQRYFAVPPQDGTEWVESIAGKFSDTRKMLEHQLVTEACRGARQNTPYPTTDRFPWNGYYTGQYFMQDYSGPMKFRRQQEILKSSDLRDFAMLPWTMVAVSSFDRTGDADLLKARQVDAKCLANGTTEVRYQVNLGEATAVVENEIFAKGWSARLLCNDCGWPDNAKYITPEDVKGFRGWNLPQGRYTFIGRFAPPYFLTGTAISIFGILLWIGIGWSIFRRSRIRVSLQTNGT